MKRIIAVAVLVLAAVALCVFFAMNNAKSDTTEIRESIIQQRDELKKLQTKQQTDAAKEPYQSPIDFEALQELNPDIYAWLEIPDVVSLPVVNHQGDNSYYHRRAIDGSYSLAGSLYTEDYNTRDFTDPITVIYGHNMNTDEMFSTLEKNYSSKEFFESHSEFTIYLPNCEKQYKIVAAVPYGKIHLLRKYDLSKTKVFEALIKDILAVREINSNVDETYSVNKNDHIVILSTCLQSNDSKRFLVVAVEKNNNK